MKMNQSYLSPWSGSGGRNAGWTWSSLPRPACGHRGQRAASPGFRACSPGSGAPGSSLSACIPLISWSSTAKDGEEWGIWHFSQTKDRERKIAHFNSTLFRAITWSYSNWMWDQTLNVIRPFPVSPALKTTDEFEYEYLLIQKTINMLCVFMSFCHIKI